MFVIIIHVLCVLMYVCIFQVLLYHNKIIHLRFSSSVGRALSWDARSRGFESHLRAHFSLKKGRWVVSGVVVLFFILITFLLSTSVHVYSYYNHLANHFVFNKTCMHYIHYISTCVYVYMLDVVRQQACIRVVCK